MPTVTEATPEELINSALDLTPSSIFELDRIQPDGSIKTWKVRVCLLRAQAEREGMIAAQAYARKYGENPADHGDIYREEQAVEIVMRSACRLEPEDREDGTRFYRRWFLSADSVRSVLTANELAALINFYQVVKSRFGVLSALDDQSIEDWAVRLSDEMLGPYFLSRLDSAHWGDALLAVARFCRDRLEEAGSPLPSLLASSESALSNLPPSIGLSGVLPGARSSEASQPSIPSDRSLTQQEADHLARELFGPKPPREPTK